MTNPFDMIVVKHMNHTYYFRPLEYNSLEYDQNTLLLKDGTPLAPIRAISQCHRCGAAVEINPQVSLVPFCEYCDVIKKPEKIADKPFTEAIPTQTIDKLLIRTVDTSQYTTHIVDDSIGKYILQENTLPQPPAVVHRKVKKASRDFMASMNSNVEFNEIIPELGDEKIEL